MRVFYFIILVTFISCKNDKQEKSYVVPAYNELYLMDSLKYAPYDYYGPNNIIILESTKDFFYHDNYTPCGTDWKVFNPPRKIEFEKSPLLKFSTIDEVINKINQSEASTKLIIIASDADTIRSPKYFDLKSKIQQSKNLSLLATRKVTADEQNAITNNYVQ